MVRKWVTWINYFACGIIGLLLFCALCFFLMSQTTFPLNNRSVKKIELPKGSFARSPQEYEAIGAPALSLAFSPLSVQLPDLRRHLIYYGKNGRPDAKEDRPTLFFSFMGNKALPTPVFPGERLYLLYDKKVTPNQYIFSQKNVPTNIWIEVSSQGNQAIVKVAMKGENEDQVIKEPAAYSEFTLPEKEFVRFGGTIWELGKWRVDGTLLARQKARWFGIDKFLEKHGGQEYQEFVNKQRIDFGEGEEIYSIYVGLTDCLIWDNDRWQRVKVGDDSLKHPLMCIKKIDERIMNLELWDVEGKGKIVLNLVKANETWLPQNLEQNFKFIGARTRSQFVFEINHKRQLLSPHDWLLLTNSEWKKLVTPKQIDDYVERRTVGPLFVFDHVERKEDRLFIAGTFFSPARTEMFSIEFPLQQTSSSAGLGKPNSEKKQKTPESNPPSMLKTGNQSVEKPVNERGQRASDMRATLKNDDEHE